MLEEYLVFAKDIAYKAKEIMLNYFNKDMTSSYKLDNTIVTNVDIEINKYLIEKVKEVYPDHSVIGEEESYGNSNIAWICDPVDGTAMYARSIPVSVFSLALVIEGKPVLGVVYDPFLDEMYSAIEGKGAYLNDNKISVNDYKLEDKRTVCHYDMWPDAPYNIYDIVKELGEKAYFISIGSIIRASMEVAKGNFSLALFPGRDNKRYDLAALKIIVKEAGGIATSLFGIDERLDREINGAIICNKVIYEEVQRVVNKYLKWR